MKFSNSLKFNSVPEWSDNYLNYPTLKKLIYSLEERQLNLSGKDDQSDAKLDEAEHHKFQKLKKKLLKLRKEKVNENYESSSSSTNGPASSADEAGIELKKLDGLRTDTFDKDDSQSTLSMLSSLHSNSENFDPRKIFVEALRRELNKIDSFYKLKEEEIFKQFDQFVHDLNNSKVHLKDTHNNFSEDKSILSRKSSIHQDIIRTMNSFNMEIDVEAQESANSNSKAIEDDEEEDDDDDDEYNANTALLNARDVTDDVQLKISLKKRVTFLFVSLSELKSFIELNKIGFGKISKKFDKELNCTVKKELIDTGKFFNDENSHIFRSTTLPLLDRKIHEIIESYSNLTNTAFASCKTELRSYLREHIVWERTTVWNDMLGLENGIVNPNAVVKTGDEAQFEKLLSIDCFVYKIPFHMWYFENVKIPKCLFTRRSLKLAIIITITGILLGVKTFNDLEQHRCMALLACVALMWASEAIPLFVTAMLVPLLVVTFKVCKDDDGSAMSAPDASAYILGTMWSSTIMLLIGGFTLAAALSKYNIAKVLSSFILAMAGTNPRIIILAIMAVATFLSMWISNVAAPVLCFSLMQGLIKSQPTGSPFVQALLLGIAFASNIGGMASPIASPQNMIAIEYMSPNPGWGNWFAVAIPTAILADILIWLLLTYTFDISTAKVKAYKPITERFTFKQIYICVVSIVTILLWCLLTKLESGLGEAGEVSIIPFVLLFGTGLLTAQDLTNFPWSIVVLAMGGIALGKAVSSSGLLSTIATALQHKIEDFPIYAIMLIFGVLILVVATFVSHTVAVLIIIPLIKEVGDSLPTPHPTLLVMVSVLIASCAMALPTSGFPNVTAISMTDEVGRPYLQVSTFITRGVPASLLAYIVIISVSYGISSSLGF